MKADWKLDQKFPTSKVVWKKLLCPVMPADPEDILRLFGLMRFLDHTREADKHDGVTSAHVPFVFLVMKPKNETHTQIAQTEAVSFQMSHHYTSPWGNL